MDRRISRETNYPSIFEKDEFLQCCVCSSQDAQLQIYRLNCHHQLCVECRKKQTTTLFICSICETKTEISTLKLSESYLMNGIKNDVQMRGKDTKTNFANLHKKSKSLSFDVMETSFQNTADDVFLRKPSLHLPTSLESIQEAERRKRKNAVCRQTKIKSSTISTDQIHSNEYFNKNENKPDDCNDNESSGENEDDTHKEIFNEHFLPDGENVISICDLHKAKISFYCRPCNVVMCPSCRTDYHRGHRTRPIKAIIDNRRQQIDESVNLFRVKTAAYFESQQRKVVRQSKLLDTTSTNAMDAIRKRGAELRSYIEFMEDMLLKDVEEKEKATKSQLKQYTLELDSEYVVADQVMKKANNVLETDSDIVVVQRCKEILETLDFDLWKSSLNLPDIVEINFKTGDLDSEKIKTGFGTCSAIQKGMVWSRSISVCQNPHRWEQMGVELLKKFKCIRKDHFDNNAMCNLSISGLATNMDNTVTVCGSEDGAISHLLTFDKNGRLLDDIVLDSLVDDIHKDSMNTTILTSFKSKKIQQMNEDGKTRVFKLFDKVRPRGVCLSRQAEKGVFVCLVDEYTTSVRSDGHRNVTLFGQDGGQQITFELNKSGDRLFTRPYRLIVNTNGDICVVDRTSMGSGRIVALSSNGDLRFIYDGIGSAADRPFSPSSICCDSQGRLLVTDTNNSCIHILDLHGTFLGFLLEKSDGIINPCAIKLSNDSTLWLAMDNYYICCFRYKFI